LHGHPPVPPIENVSLQTLEPIKNVALESTEPIENVVLDLKTAVKPANLGNADIVRHVAHRAKRAIKP
jgi:hypothetical protein